MGSSSSSEPQPQAIPERHDAQNGVRMTISSKILDNARSSKISSGVEPGGVSETGIKSQSSGSAPHYTHGTPHSRQSGHQVHEMRTTSRTMDGAYDSSGSMSDVDQAIDKLVDSVTAVQVPYPAMPALHIDLIEITKEKLDSADNAEMEIEIPIVNEVAALFERAKNIPPYEFPESA